MDNLMVDALRDLLAGQCSPAVVRAIETQAAGSADGDGSDAARGLWRQIEASGFADLLVAESAGGAGLSLRDAFAAWDLLGQHAMPLPLAETMLVRGWLAQAGQQAPEGAIALATELRAGEDGGLQATGVRGARVADWALAEWGGQWLLLPVAQARRQAGVFVLDADLHWSEAVLAQARTLPAPTDLRTSQAALMAALLAGGLLAVFERTLQYANDRQQFGRAIGKFQAIQHELSVMAEHVSAARMAAQIACAANGLVPDPLRVAVGKARASEAAVEVASLAHSIHGAIGFTAEFDLQLWTRRLHLWRQTAGSESYWQQQAGQALLRADGPSLDMVRAVTDDAV